ncbi:hypothetical protein PR048_016780 [Dryococelus australis]|uniref:Uncharacterized protein n=1 Tax=Dryococelus australis TaxID=614101 RepID=A0ABQ9H7N8_9NEOP|nr:hypothetical protein PR048_016780 [Dryococelus australis]
MRRRGIWRSPRKPASRLASPGTIPTCENPGVNGPGIEPCSPWWRVSSLTAQPPPPPVTSRFIRKLRGDVLLMNKNVTVGSATSEYIVVEFPTCHTTRLSPRRIRFDFRRGHPRILTCGNRAGRCHWSVDFLRVLSFPPPFHSGAAPYSPRFTIICSQDLDVKSRPNLFTHSLQHATLNSAFSHELNSLIYIWNVELARFIGASVGLAVSKLGSYNGDRVSTSVYQVGIGGKQNENISCFTPGVLYIMNVENVTCRAVGRQQAVHNSCARLQVSQGFRTDVYDGYKITTVEYPLRLRPELEPRNTWPLSGSFGKAMWLVLGVRLLGQVVYQMCAKFPGKLCMLSGQTRHYLTSTHELGVKNNWKRSNKRMRLWGKREHPEVNPAANTMSYKFAIGEKNSLFDPAGNRTRFTLGGGEREIPEINPTTNDIIRHDYHMRKSGLNPDRLGGRQAG